MGQEQKVIGVKSGQIIYGMGLFFPVCFPLLCLILSLIIIKWRAIDFSISDTDYKFKYE